MKGGLVSMIYGVAAARDSGRSATARSFFTAFVMRRPAALWDPLICARRE